MVSTLTYGKPLVIILIFLAVGFLQFFWLRQFMS